jgi:hypothetical protein
MQDQLHVCGGGEGQLLWARCGFIRTANTQRRPPAPESFHVFRSPFLVRRPIRPPVPREETNEKKKMADPKAIAQQFCTAYYRAMQAERASIGKFYRETSTLTFQGQEFKGITAIAGKLNSLGGRGEDDEVTQAEVKYKLTKCDIQVSKAPSSLVLLLIGQLSIDGAEPMGFAQFVHLSTDDGRQWYIFNDMFRLLVE